MNWTDSCDYAEISIFKQSFKHICSRSSYGFIVQPLREHSQGRKNKAGNSNELPNIRSEAGFAGSKGN